MENIYIPQHDTNTFSKPLVWDFSDYQDYLQAYLAYKRSGKSPFSVRQFCLSAGISTENYLLKIIRGERNLGQKLTEAFIRALKLSRAEAQYFRVLTQVRLVKAIDQKEVLLNQLELLRRKAKRPPPVLDNSMLRHWYLPVIWELASCKHFIFNPHNIAEALQNKISVQEIKEAIEYLVRKNYLVETPEGHVQGETPVFTTNGKSDPILKLHHKESVSAAIPAIDLPIEERGFFGLTIAIDKSKVPELKARLKKFLDQVQADLACDPNANAVYRINAHCFPLAVTNTGGLKQSDKDTP